MDEIYCIYCEEYTPKQKFEEHMKQCYYNKYFEEPFSISLKDYLERLHIMGIGNEETQ